ncbi:MAG: hypothetical protein IPJ82_21220, partial [Lewinellaceae bacterium]|nr:hypothetical protein [Lewinellaceae bacterium]
KNRSKAGLKTAGNIREDKNGGTNNAEQQSADPLLAREVEVMDEEAFHDE